MLTPDPTFQGMASERARRQIMREIRRALTRSPLMQPPSGVVQSNVVNGYRDENGDFVLYAAYDRGGGYDSEGMR